MNFGATSKVMWTDESKFTLFQSDGNIRVGSVHLSSAYSLIMWGQYYDLGLLQLVVSMFSTVTCPKKNEII